MLWNSFFLPGHYLQVLYIDIIFKNIHALEHYIPRKMCSMCYCSTCSIICLVCCRIKRKMKRMPQWKSFTLVLCDKHAFEEKYGEQANVTSGRNPGDSSNEWIEEYTKVFQIKCLPVKKSTCIFMLFHKVFVHIICDGSGIYL